MKSLPRLLFSILLCELTGFLSSLYVMGEINSWYATLTKPFFSPPNWIFGPVWTLLYALMGIYLYKVWVSKMKLRSLLLPLFALQLLLNFLWSLFFFNLHDPLLALIDILALWFVLFVLIAKTSKTSWSIAWLLIPYILWVSFATLLNIAILTLN